MQMKITTDYAIRTLIYLACNSKRIISSAEVADAMKIPQKYLMRVCSVLKHAGMIEAYSGQNGGYVLRIPADKIRLYDVVSLTEGTIKINRCLEDDEYCSRNAIATCSVCRSYHIMQNKFENFLKGITIYHLINDISEKEIENIINYKV